MITVNFKACHISSESRSRCSLNDDAADNQKQPPQTVRHSTVPRASNDSTQRAHDNLTIQAQGNSAEHASDHPTIWAPDNPV